MGSSHQARGHLASIDAVRGLAALYVLMHHAVQTATYDGRIKTILTPLFAHGNIAVDVFIVLSGFSLGLAAWRGTQPRFGIYIARRAIRILPTYYAALFLSLAYILILQTGQTKNHWDGGAEWTWVGLLAHLVMIHDWIPVVSRDINYVLWSVAVEWKIYFLLPAIMLLFRRTNIKLGLFMIGCAAYTTWAITYKLNILNPWPSGNSFYYVFLFSLGVASARLYLNDIDKSSKSNTKWWTLGTSAFFVILAKILIGKFIPQDAAPQILSFATGIFSACLLYCAATASPAITSSLPIKFLARLGVYAYSIYLFHPIFVQWCWEYGFWPRTMSPSIVVPALVGVSLIGCYFCFVLLERPFHDASRRFGKKEATLPVTKSELGDASALPPQRG